VTKKKVFNIDRKTIKSFGKKNGGLKEVSLVHFFFKTAAPFSPFFVLFFGEG
jgi:hypothetical protein